MLHLKIIVVYTRIVSVGSEKQCCTFWLSQRDRCRQGWPSTCTQPKTDVIQSPKPKHRFSPTAWLTFFWLVQGFLVPFPARFSNTAILWKDKVSPTGLGYPLLFKHITSAPENAHWRWGSALELYFLQKCTLWLQYVIIITCMPVSPWF